MPNRQQRRRSRIGVQVTPLDLVYAQNAAAEVIRAELAQALTAQDGTEISAHLMGHYGALLNASAEDMLRSAPTAKYQIRQRTRKTLRIVWQSIQNAITAGIAEATEELQRQLADVTAERDAAQAQFAALTAEFAPVPDPQEVSPMPQPQPSARFDTSLEALSFAAYLRGHGQPATVPNTDTRMVECPQATSADLAAWQAEYGSAAEQRQLVLRQFQAQQALRAGEVAA